jgi:hypothetical protein
MVALEPNTVMQHTLPFAPRIRENVAEMSRLINAALVDQNFCNRLLFDPEMAIQNGYNGEKFSLSSLEIEFVLNVRAETLNEFAVRWSKCSRDLISTAEYMDVMLPVRTQNC